MDITQNDIENDHIEYVPSLRLYKQKKMTEYKGELDLEDIK